MCAKLDAFALREMFLTGTEYLNNKKDLINELNVFPVPDGDTGTNMTLTLMNCARELAVQKEGVTINEFCSKVSTGTLRSARGNSGVIMSQLCRGFAEKIRDSKEIGKELMADALENAVKTAYNAVLNPVEGTMLTVARAASEKARELSTQNISMEDFLSEILKNANAVLQKTPEMLPVLKEAGVVDSGGQGLVEFLTGAHDSVVLEHLQTADHSFLVSGNSASGANVIKPEKHDTGIDISSISTSDIKYIYCTEFIINLTDKDVHKEEKKLKKFLGNIGDSVVCVGIDDLIKVHVHTNHPGQVIETALASGELSSLKIDNMRIEHNERVISHEDRQAGNAHGDTDKSYSQKYAFISVCSGSGISEIYRDLGAEIVIDGGQTMNPSTDDFLKAIEDTDAENIYLIPNNSNIIMAAQQARDLLPDRNIYVIPSTNICQGISALISFDESLSPEENTGEMIMSMETVKYVEVTYAVRDTKINGKHVTKGDYIGISGNKCLAVSSDPEDAANKAVSSIADDETQLITIYYGLGVSEDRIQKLKDTMEQTYDADIETVFGGQKVYDYIISVE